MSPDEELKEILANLHKEYKTSSEYKVVFHQLLKARGQFYLDHPWSETLNGITKNAQLRLQLMQEEESRSLPNLIKKAIITETLKFMVPFILGFAVAYFGIPYYKSQQIISTQNSSTKTQNP